MTGSAGFAEARSAGAAIAAVSGSAEVAGGAKEPLPVPIDESAYVRFAQNICDPNTGIGADGLIIVREVPALEMVFFNRDGSRAPMCGNGIRCFAYFCLNEGICSESSYPVKTLAGDMVVNVVSREPFAARIDMGRPVFAPDAVGVDSEAPDLMDFTVQLRDGSRLPVSSLFMGTVHTVVFVDDLSAADIAGLGREVCEHPVFREKTNVNFVQILDDAALEMRTYERGVGPTLACGTGACASVVAAELKGLCGRRAEVRLELGALGIELMEDGHVYMEGPSVKICDGVLGAGAIPAAGGKER